MNLFYMSHPVSPKDDETIEGNLARAKRWRKWLVETFPQHAFIAPWIEEIEIIGSDGTPVERERGLLRDCAWAARSDAVILVGGRVGSGGLREGQAAPRIADLTALGVEPPYALEGDMLALLRRDLEGGLRVA